MKNKNNPPPRLIVDPTTPQSPEQQHPFSLFAMTTQSAPRTTTIIKPSNFHPAFIPILNYLNTPLFPLVSITSGLQHPDFPPNLLAFHVLTSTQLDNLARHYHQVWPPVEHTSRYPTTIPAWVGAPNEQDVDLETKRRRFGTFIGLQGCEDDDEPVDDNVWPHETEEELLLRIEREWQAALARARQEEDSDRLLLRKTGGGRY